MRKISVEKLKEGDLFLYKGLIYVMTDFGNSNMTDVFREDEIPDTFLDGTQVKFLPIKNK